MKTEMGLGVCGTILSATGTATQTNEVLQTVSLVITIIGAIVSFIVIPVLNWYHNAKKDGKITSDEVKDGIEIAKDGIEKTQDIIKKGNKDNGQQN